MDYEIHRPDKANLSVPLRALTKRNIYGATTAFLRIHPYNPCHTIYTRPLLYATVTPTVFRDTADVAVTDPSSFASFPLASQCHA